MRSVRPRAWQSNGRGLLCGAAVALFLAAQLGQVLHHVVIEHVRCAAHGDLMHVSGAGHDAHAMPERDDRGTTVSSVAADHSEEHEHCTLAAVPRARPLPLASALGLARGGEAAVVAPVSLPGAYVRVLTCAPKTSPPA